MKRITRYLLLLVAISSVLSGCAIVPLRPAYVGGGGYWHGDHDYRGHDYYGR
jgi:hypothetical protein